ncbi:MAG: hypothetical protein ACPGXL_06430 [Chitinophagales bacterium]
MKLRITLHCCFYWLLFLSIGTVAQTPELDPLITNALSGRWIGVVTQNPGGLSKSYYFELEIEQAGNKITGSSFTALRNGRTGVSINLKGFFNGKILHFIENDILETFDFDSRLGKNEAWCIKQGDLEFSQKNSNFYLNGDWEGYNSRYTHKDCAPGKISLRKGVDIPAPVLEDTPIVAVETDATTTDGVASADATAETDNTKALPVIPKEALAFFERQKNKTFAPPKPKAAAPKAKSATAASEKSIVANSSEDIIMLDNTPKIDAPPLPEPKPDIEFEYNEPTVELNSSSVITIKKNRVTKFRDRKVKIGQNVAVKTPFITLYVYDHKKIDGDIITLNYNGNDVLREYNLVKEKEKIELVIDTGVARNYLILHAHNNGTVPPNTIALEFNDGTRDRQIVLNSSLDTSDIIYFTYQPDEE